MTRVETLRRRIAELAWVAAVLVCPCTVIAQGQGKELDTPYVPTPQAVVDKMLDMAQVKAGDVVIDLGSGDGRIMITAAQRHGARGFGVDIDPRLVQRSNDEARRLGVADRVKFLRQDLFNTDFHEADVLTLYLLPDVNMALRPRILGELKPGTRVVSHDYDMGVWRPEAQETLPAPDKAVGARKESTVYLWIVPAKVEGAWEVEIRIGRKARRISLVLEQQYQSVSGAARLPEGGSLPISEGRLRGDELRLTLPGGVVARDPVDLIGRAAGDSLSGTVRRADREIATWSAL